MFYLLDICTRLLGQRAKLEDCCHILSLERMRKWGILRMHWKLCEDTNPLVLQHRGHKMGNPAQGCTLTVPSPAQDAEGSTWSSHSRGSLNDGDTDESTGSPAKLSLQKSAHYVNTWEELLIQGRLLRKPLETLLPLIFSTVLH